MTYEYSIEIKQETATRWRWAIRDAEQILIDDGYEFCFEEAKAALIVAIEGVL